MALKVTVLEVPATFGEVDVAFTLVDRLLAQAPPGDLVLLPEACLTGYVSPRLDFDVGRFAEGLDGRCARGLAELARRYQTHLVGPLVELDGARRYNSLVGFTPDGERFLHYRKRHPWHPETWATPGDLPWPLVKVQDVHLTAAVCFDAHFLAEEADDQLRAADLLLFSSAWVDEGQDSRTPLLADLARRFNVVVANANWGQGAVRVVGQGGSVVLGRAGQVLATVQKGRASADVAVRAGA